MQTVAVIGLGFGDEGKGSIVDYLANTLRAEWIIRANGGAQAGHNVVTGDGRHHTFAQFSAGTFRPHVRTYLSRFFFLDVLALRNEAAILEGKGVLNPLDRLYISSDATVLTPMQRTTNRLRELARGNHAHGTCGLGIGEAFSLGANADLQIFASDLNDVGGLKKKLSRQQEYYLHETAGVSISTRDPGRREVRELILDLEFPDLPRVAAEKIHGAARGLQIVADKFAASIFESNASLIFEGAQGMLLDQDLGFPPFVTPSHTGFTNPTQMLREHNSTRELIRLGVARTYMTRHGAGPLPTEFSVISNPKEIAHPHLPEAHNDSSGMQGAFRRGWTDLVLLEYGIRSAGGIDALALTHADRLPEIELLCRNYINLTVDDLLQSGRESRTTLLEGAIPEYENPGKTSPRPRHGNPQDLEIMREIWKDFPLEIVSYGPGSDAKHSVGRNLGSP